MARGERRRAVGGVAVAGRLQAVALSLPETWEDAPWGDHVAKVGQRIFAFLGQRSLGVKLPRSSGYALTEPGVEAMRYGLGRHGWVTVDLEAARLPLDLLEDWVVESYQAVAPKRLVRLLAVSGAGVAPAGHPPPTPPGRAPRSSQGHLDTK